MLDFDFARTASAKNSGLAYSAMMIIYVILSFIGQGILSSFLATESFPYLFISSLFSVVALAIAVVLFKDKTENIFYASGVKKFRPVYLIPTVMLSCGMFFGLGFVNGLIGTVIQNAGLKAGAVGLPLDGIGTFLLFSVTLAVFPAVVEEAFFRGVLVGGLCDVPVYVRAVTVGLFFALYHCSATQFAYQFVYGFFLTFITLKTGSAIPAMLAHFLNNFSVLLLTYINVSIDFYSVYAILPGLVLIAGAFVFLYFVKGKEDGKAKAISGKAALRDFVLYGLLGAGICLLIMILGLFI